MAPIPKTTTACNIGSVPAPRVLVVEDEEPILEMIRYGLEREGFRVQTVVSGEEALPLVREELPDVVLLDLMLPGIDGLEVCRRLKGEAQTAGIPLVMLTARDAETDVVAGLELGADDYLTKPFSPRILAARLRAVLRRREAGEPSAEQLSLTAGEFSLDRQRREAVVGGARIDLTYTEFEILWLLASHPGRVYTRSRIVEVVRGAEAGITERAIDVRLVGLRRKLGPAAGRIGTVRGVGYRFGD
jgi:two-component system, OmpR family, alkaline phosphatase synthesis response regulator PhoP